MNLKRCWNMPSDQRSAGSERRLATDSRRALSSAVSLFAILLLVGCNESIDTTYGRRTGVLGGKSVNGTNVFAKMFQDAGHQVRTKRYLTDNLREDCDVIVWFPDDFSEPTAEHVGWLNDWLSWEDGRTLIYVGRDFDAGPLYYDKVIPGAAGDQISQLKNQQFVVQNEHTKRRGTLTGTPQCEWFLVDTTTKQRAVTTLAGPFGKGIDASKIDITLHSRLKPKKYWPENEYTQLLDPDSSAVLLKFKNDIIVSRQRDQYSAADSQFILVANGSFLLNMMLVNHEHRKLAQKLIGELGDDQQRVVFLESGPGGPEIMAEEPSQEFPTSFAILTQRPLDVILFHLAVLGIVFCLSRWPIFGRERRAEKTATSDFGRHVEALGELIERTGDLKFAQDRLRNYQQHQSEKD